MSAAAPILLIVPGPEAAAQRWRESRIGNWGAAFVLRLERAGLLTYEVSDERALDRPRHLAGRDLIIVGNLPPASWTAERQYNLQAAACGIFVEGPVPDGVLGLSFAMPVEPPAIVVSESPEKPIALDLPRPQTRPMRLDASLLPVSPDATLEERVGIRAALCAAYYCTRHTDGPSFGSADADAMAALAVAMVVRRCGGAPVAASPEAGLRRMVADARWRTQEAPATAGRSWRTIEQLIAAERSPTTPRAPFRAGSVTTDAWGAVAAALDDPARVLGPVRARDPRLEAAGVLPLWAVATFLSGESAAAACRVALRLVEGIWAGELLPGQTDMGVSPSLLLAAAAWRADPANRSLRALWERALAPSNRFLAPFDLKSGNAEETGAPSVAPCCALALASMCESISLPIPPPSKGVDADLASAEAWFRCADMGGAFAAPAWLDVIAWRTADGAPVVMRRGRLCVSAVPLLSLVCQTYAAPPLDGTFLNRPMRPIKRLEVWLLRVLFDLAAHRGRGLVRVAPWPAGKAFACTITHDLDRIPTPPDFARLLEWERSAGLKSSWYWIWTRTDRQLMEQIAAAGFESGLHAVLAARKQVEAHSLAAMMPAGASIRGETLHGGGGGDHWRGAASVLQAHAAGLSYTEHCPTAHDLPDTGFAVLHADGSVVTIPIVGLTHAVCIERNPVKEEEVYQRDSLARIVADGGYCLVSNHPDMSFDTLREWMTGLPLDRAWHATAAEVADWWRSSHARAALAIDIRRRLGETEVVAAAVERVEGLVLRIPVSASCIVADGASVLSHQNGEMRILVDIEPGRARTIRLREVNRTRRIALVRPAGLTASAIPALGRLLDVTDSIEADLIHLSDQALHLDSSRASPERPAFIFSPIDPPVDTLLITSRTFSLFPNVFSAAWVGTLLERGEAAEVLVTREGGENFDRLLAVLRACLPADTIDEGDPDWVRLVPSDGLAGHLAALPTSYVFLHGAWPGFRELYGAVEHSDSHLSVNGDGPAEARFMYSFSGASRNSLVLERLADRLGWGPRPDMLDIGGGHGFLGLEMAAKGWTVTVAEHDPAKTEVIGPWLARLSPRSLALRFRTVRMEDIPLGALPAEVGGLQVVTFFSSLFFARRDCVRALLRNCRERLAPGGAVLIHELVRQSKDEHLHDRRFEYRELIDLVTEGVGPPSYISIVDGSPMDQFVPGLSALLIVNGAAARLEPQV